MSETEEKMERITILGPSGSGKSTLARELGHILKVPVVHLDTLFFKPNWEEIPKLEFLKKVETIISTEENWIIEGNYTITWDVRFQHSTSILFLDYPRRIYFWRVIKRLIMYRGKTRPDAAVGCVEKLDFEFLKFVWSYPKRRKETISRLEKEQGNILIFKSPKETAKFIQQLK
ncbi:topology modulation protein [Listeria fleischmannii]|uniref:topology modulation protein n=1 Tax=Listeria fleischmannii TaxID=1069827 RepID=UPI0021AB0E9F|nr:topology modulation protein [Listeria fleischmannii]